MKIKKGTITGDLKLTLLQLGYTIPSTIFSDPRKDKKAVSVKLCGIQYTSRSVKAIITQMERMGHEFIKDNNTCRTHKANKPYLERFEILPHSGYFDGHRFIFWKGDMYHRNLEKVLE